MVTHGDVGFFVGSRASRHPTLIVAGNTNRCSLELGLPEELSAR